MVFTWPVRMADTGPNGGRQTWSRPAWSRRKVLRGAMLAAVAGTAAPLAACGLLDDEPDPPPPPDPLAPLISGALALAARHDATISEYPELSDRLSPIAAAHRAHAEELARITRTALPSGTTGATQPSTSPGAGPAAGDVPSALAELRAAEQQGREIAADACGAAPANRAALLGSIAAARATHAEVLR